jgi:phage tail sheath gpL-like
MVNTPITLTGVGPNQLPGVYGQINFATGQLSLGSANYAALILANIRQDGSGTAFGNIDGYQLYGPDTPIVMQQVSDANTLFGPGSPAALMVADFMALNKSTPLYVVPVRQPVGGTAATFTLTVTLSGTLTNGSISLQVGPDAPVVTTVNASIDTATSIAANMANNVNATNLLPVIATSNAGVLTLTTKTVGARNNWLRAAPKIQSGTGVVLSVSQPAFFTGGAGSDSADLQAVLNSLAVNGLRFYYYVPEAGCDSVDTTQFEAVQTQIDALATPVIGLRQRAVGGSVDTLANTQTVTTTVNDPRVEAINLPQAETTPARLAARGAAVYALQEIPPLAAQGVNFDGFGNDSLSFALWNVAAPLNGTAPSVTSLQSATITGVTPLQVQRGGRTSIVKRVTSRFYTNGAGTFDGRITDGGKVTICDQFLDDLTSQIVSTFPRKLIASDPAQGQPPVGPGVATPGLVQQVVNNVINTYAARNLINGPNTLANVVVQRETSPTSRISVQVGLFTNDLLHTVILQINQNT